MTPVRLEPAALRSRVKHSTTEPLRSPFFVVVTTRNAHNMKPVQKFTACAGPEGSNSDKVVVVFFVVIFVVAVLI